MELETLDHITKEKPSINDLIAQYGDTVKRSWEGTDGWRIVLLWGYAQGKLHPILEGSFQDLSKDLPQEAVGLCRTVVISQTVPEVGEATCLAIYEMVDVRQFKQVGVTSPQIFTIAYIQTGTTQCPFCTRILEDTSICPNCL